MIEQQKASRSVVVTNPQGLHARPADMFVKLANQFNAKVEVIKDDACERIDGKSILEVLTLAALEGTRLVLEATGPDAEEAIDALVKLVENDFPGYEDFDPDQTDENIRNPK